MSDVDKFVNDILTHNIKIGVLVAQIERRYPGKTLAELLIEGALA